ncbi:MAG: hypothetical protein ACI4KM_01680 [Oscillospiraceae bacterium]
MNFRLLRRPRIAAFAIMGLDMLLLLVCVILSILEGTIGVVYESDSKLNITVQSPFWYFGIVAAVIVVLQAGFTAVMIIANFNSGQRGQLWHVNLAAAVLMAISALIAMLSVQILVHDFDEIYSYAYTDNSKTVVLMERRRAVLGECTLVLFKVDGDKPYRAATIPLREVGGTSDRYSLEWISEDELCISFNDGYNLRYVNLIVE